MAIANPVSAFPEDDVRRGVELIYFGYSHLTRAADERLSAQGLGRAHHRLLYFVARQPGLTVSALLRLLNITKQALSRVLGELTRRGLIRQETGIEDRRHRRLFLTETGQTLEQALFADLSTKMKSAYDETGQQGVDGFWRVLLNLVPPEDRDLVKALAD